MTRLTTRPVAVVLSNLMIVGAAGSSPAQVGSVAAARRVLADRGLTRVGPLYLLDEEDALTKFAEANQVVTDFLAVVAQRNAILGIQAQIQEANRQKAILGENNTDLRTFLQSLNIKNEYARFNHWNSADRTAHEEAEATIRANDSVFNNLNKQIRQWQEQLPPPPRRQAIFDECARLSEVCRASVRDLGYVMEPIAAKYRELAADHEVRDALATLNRATREKVKLGPSPRFSTTNKRLQQTKKDLDPPRPRTPSKKGGRRRR